MPWHFAQLGLPYEPGFYPTTFSSASDKMTYVQRLANWFAFVYMNTMYKIFNRNDANKLLRQRFGDDFPDVAELSKTVSMMFVNQHYSLSGAKHISPNVIELGGVHIGKPKPLDPVTLNFLCFSMTFLNSSVPFFLLTQKLQEMLDNAKHGVIYLSWGSMVKADTLSEEKREGILRALGKFKQLVLWKYENETMPNQPPNVIIRKWMPQREILCKSDLAFRDCSLT
jgi:glucuronosyltransferase